MIYKEALSALKTIIQENETYNKRNRLKYCTLDFEQALHSQFSQIFLEVKIIGCFFHFSQALERYAKKVHLDMKQQETLDLIQYMKDLCWLDVTESNLEEISEKLYDRIIEFKLFVDYFLKQWIPLICNGVLDFKKIDQQYRTNSSIESYNNNLKRKIPMNVDFVSFIGHLKKEEQDSCKNLYFHERRGESFVSSVHKKNPLKRPIDDINNEELNPQKKKTNNDEFLSQDNDFSSENHDYNIFGLINPKFQCYLNSVIQCLFNIKKFIDFLSKYEISNNDNEKFIKSAEILKIIKKILTIIKKQKLEDVDLQKKTYQKYNISKYFKETIETSFNSNHQHDAHEFITFIFVSIIKELTPYATSTLIAKREKILRNTSSFDVFEEKYSEFKPDFISQNSSIILENEIECGLCHNKIDYYDYMHYLSLSIQGQNSIENCLKINFKLTILDDYKCENEKCKVVGYNQKKTNCIKCPEILIIKLKRFKDSEKQFMTKINETVEFSADYLDIKE